MHISEAAAPRPYGFSPCPNSLAPCPNIIFFFFKRSNCCFCVFRQPMNCADLCPCFHRSHTISFRSRAGLRPYFGRSRSKLCPIVCRLRTKLCPYFGRSRARLCPISFAPCPFPNRAGTLYYPAMWHHKIRNTAQRSRTFSFSQQNVSFTFLCYRFSRVIITTMLRCRVATCGIFWEIVFFPA